MIISYQQHYLYFNTDFNTYLKYPLLPFCNTEACIVVSIFSKIAIRSLAVSVVSRVILLIRISVLLYCDKES